MPRPKKNQEETQEQKRPIGRPSAYKPEYAIQAAKLCQAGLTDWEISRFFDVSTVTINAWKNKYPDFLNALKSGKYQADERVERSLYHRAIGYSFEAVKIFPPKGLDGKPVIVPYIEHVPPDTTAAIFWLKNRRRDEWRDVHKHEIGRAGDFDQLTDDELLQELSREAQLLIEHSPVEDGDNSE